MNIHTPLWHASVHGYRPQPSRRAFKFPSPRGHLAEPRPSVEPSNSKEDALIEAHRIAASNPFRCGFVWCYLGRWYAANQRPAVPQMGSFGGLGDILCIEIDSKGEASVSPVTE